MQTLQQCLSLQSGVHKELLEMLESTAAEYQVFAYVRKSMKLLIRNDAAIKALLNTTDISVYIEND